MFIGVSGFGPVYKDNILYWMLGRMLGGMSRMLLVVVKALVLAIFASYT